jgi:uncharacterized protein YoxC
MDMQVGVGAWVWITPHLSLGGIMYVIHTFFHLTKNLLYLLHMKQVLREQYRAIRSSIQSNVETIGSLIRQAHNLRDIVNTLNGAPENKEIKERLESEIDEIEKTIGTLISQTDSLFESYNRFVEGVLAK